jgi:hypothetical protein
MNLPLLGLRILNILSNAGKPFFSSFESYNPLTNLHSLEKDPSRRATPWRMLEHPWMVEMKSKKVNMPKFLQQVWNWTD